MRKVACDSCGVDIAESGLNGDLTLFGVGPWAFEVLVWNAKRSPDRHHKPRVHFCLDCIEATLAGYLKARKQAGQAVSDAEEAA